MTKVNNINISQQFSDSPGGRYLSDGPGNATDFRTRFLVPVLEENGRAILDLDGVAGLPSSFLEEAFGGLVRLGYDPIKIKKAFDFTSTEPGYERFKPMIHGHIDRASHAAKH